LIYFINNVHIPQTNQDIVLEKQEERTSFFERNKEIKKGSLQLYSKVVRCIKLNTAYVSVIQKQLEAVLGYSYMYQQQHYLFEKNSQSKK
jgi:hypothetical protein